MPTVPDDYLDPWSEGDARTKTHARACEVGGGCRDHMSDRCWCHGIRTRQDGSPRADHDFLPTPRAEKVRLADKTWGAGNWIWCDTCPTDHFDRPVMHHKDAHGSRDTEPRK